MCSRADTAEVSVAVYAGTIIQTRATGTFVVVYVKEKGNNAFNAG